MLGRLLIGVTFGFVAAVLAFPYGYMAAAVAYVFVGAVFTIIPTLLIEISHKIVGRGTSSLPRTRLLMADDANDEKAGERLDGQIPYGNLTEKIRAN